MPPNGLPREKPCELEPELPPPALDGESSTGRATVRLPKERMLEESESSERPLNDLPLKVGLLEPLPNERIERSAPPEPELGIWNEFPLRPLKLRPESPPNDDRDCIEEPPDEKLRPDDPLLPLLLLLEDRPL